MPTPRSGLSVVSLKGNIYAIGGRNEKNKAVGVVERYDPQARQWEEVASLHHPRYNAASAVWRGRIVVMGGRGPDEDDGEGDGGTDEDVLGSAEVYDAGSDEWKAFPALQKERVGAAAVNVKGRLYVFGGAKLDEALLTSIEQFNPEENEWSEIELTLPQPRLAMAAASIGSTAFLIGGLTGKVPLIGPTDSILRFDLQKGVMELETKLPAPSGGVAAASAKGDIYVIGGLGTTGNVLSTGSIFNRSGKTLSVKETFTLTTGRADAGAASLADTIFVAGGTGPDGSVLASVESRTVTMTDMTRGDALAPPSDFGLGANHPNPFQTRTRIPFRTSQRASRQPTALHVYDALGRRVATLVDRVLPAGPHRITWNGTSDSGRHLPSGIYVLRLHQGDLRTTRTLTLVR